MEILNNMYKFTDTNADISDSLAYKTLEVAEKENIKNLKNYTKNLANINLGQVI